MVTINRDDVQSVYGNQEPSIDAPQQTDLVRIAERLTDNVFGGRIAGFSEIEGNKEDFTKYLAAHLWELAEGGEPTSESQTGGSVNFNHLQTNIENTLTETRFGRTCMMYMRQSTSSGIIRADR